MRQIDVTDLFGPKIVFRHIGEPPERPKPARPCQTPAGFFERLAMKGGQGRFSRVDPAAWKLKFGDRLGLMGQQDIRPSQKDRIGPGPLRIAHISHDGFAHTAYHDAWTLGCRPYIDAICQPMARKETPMTLGSQIAWDDTVLPFQLDRPDIRGRVARLDGVLDQVLAQHNYPAPIEALVAEAALLTALIGQTIKLRWKLSLQVRGDGPGRLIATDYYAPTEDGQPARLRAYASYDAERLSETVDPFLQIGKGYFAVLVDQGRDMTPYQGITPIAGGSLAACAETYFAQSEQLPTRFALSFGRSTLAGQAEGWRAGGVMLQHMPEASPFAKDGGSGDDGLLQPADVLDADELENWTRANLLLDTVEELELVGPTVHPTDLLVRLFHEETPRVFDAQPVSFGCTCSSDRVRQSLSIYSARDIGHMTTDEGIVTADCQFCGAHYEFEPQTLGFEATEPSGDGN